MNKLSTKKLKSNQTHLQGARENVTHPLHPFLQGLPGPLSAVAKGCWEPGGSTSFRRQGLGPCSDAAQQGEENPERTSAPPAWPTSPGHSPTVEVHRLLLALVPL